MENIRSILTSIRPMNEESQRLASLIFLAIAGGMSFLEYTHVRILWDYHLSFTPRLLSTALAVCMVAPLYLRGILKWNMSVYTTISLVLILLVFGSFVELSLGGNNRNEFVTTALGAALLLSWLGIKEVAALCWVLVLIVGLYCTLSNSAAMGIYGYVYIVCGFLGLLFHSKLSPGELIAGIRAEYK
jgi:hypothetical protein